MKTLQQLFTHIVTALRAQGRTSMVRPARMLRGPNGTRCALGCLIPDDVKITEVMEANSDAVMFMRTYPAIAQLAGIDTESQTHRRFVSDMLYIHDSTPVEEWEDRWRALAEVFSLDYTAA